MITTNVDELKHAIDQKADIVILDVRTRGELAMGKIEKSLNLPVDEVATSIESLIPKKDACIYVYCLSGSRSTLAAQIMTQLGYTDVRDVAHGLLAWRIKHYPEVKSEV